MANFRAYILALGMVAISATSSIRASDVVAGSLIVFNDNGGWSWFESERAVFDAAHGQVIVSSVANSHGTRGADRGGDVDVVSFDLATRETRRFTLHKKLEEDDHDSAAMLILADGRYLASYSKHSADNHLLYRVSAKPGDISTWQPELTFDTAGGTTYSNLCYLSKSNTVFDFFRDHGRGFDPNYLVWNLGQASGFSYGGHLLTGPEGNASNRDRPYLRYVSNGVDRIHFLTSDHHPRNLVSNSVYHGYIERERGRYGVYRSDGTRLGELSTTDKTPYKSSNFTRLLEGDAVSPIDGLRLTRAWPTDMELDRAGDPHVLFSARVSDNDQDHRFFYGRLKNGRWQILELAHAGGHLYDGENDYTGLGALDPGQPARVYISTKIDPLNQQQLKHYEIFEGVAANDGTAWTWRAITRESSVDNLRPVVPRAAAGRSTLVWLRGTYRAYTDYTMNVVGLTRITPIASDDSAARP